MHTLSSHGSIYLNRRLGGKFPHLTICAEAWILHRTRRILFLDLLIFLIFWEMNHCRNQYLKYGANLKGKTYETNENFG
jgi:hypothetical protein